MTFIASDLKKILLVGAVAVPAFVLAACGKKEEAPAPAPSTTEAPAAPAESAPAAPAEGSSGEMAPAPEAPAAPAQ